MDKWNKISLKDQANRILSELGKNKSYENDYLLGIPGSYLDSRVFPRSDIVSGNPFLTTLSSNPNHIGVHTEGSSEVFFSGTQNLEREVLAICAESLLKCESKKYDGYVASGGTEANIQASWVLRNFFREGGLKNNEICIMGSSDTHYSIHKAANILDLQVSIAEVNTETRQIDKNGLKAILKKLQGEGIRGIIFFLNMGTTMFGSVDDIESIDGILCEFNFEYRYHIDAAFGGFIYPLTNPKQKLNFLHPKVASATLDAHKMLQAPYGTGVYLCRKGLMNYTSTDKAQYVRGFDSTLCGSRSGANTVAVWMILHSYGYDEAQKFCEKLVDRAKYLCNELERLGISFFYQKYMNIVTIKAECISREIINKYSLVLDNTRDPQWAKIVVMEHVKMANIKDFLNDIKRGN
jgi:glutamate/tyrosine decarboxylase-like PLP-dependent enzyme